MSEPAKVLSPDELYAEWSKPATTPQTDEEWAARGAQTRIVAAALLMLRAGQRVGSMQVAEATWNGPQAGQRGLGARVGTDEWYKRMGAHDMVLLTEDGRHVNSTTWCLCGPEVPDAQYVRYERWSREGLSGHGYVHSICRCLLQTG